MAESRVAAVLLAAGASRRLGTPKQLLLDEHGMTLVARAARLLTDAGCSPIVVVTGAEAVAVGLAVSGLPLTVVHNSAWEDGMGRSIACGVEYLAQSPSSLDVAAVLIAACDMPTVDTSHLQALIRQSANGTIRTSSEYMAAESAVGASIMRGIPAILPRADWPWLAALDGDRGAKLLLMEAGGLSVQLVHGMFDLDTPADVAGWRGGSTR